MKQDTAGPGKSRLLLIAFRRAAQLLRPCCDSSLSDIDLLRLRRYIEPRHHLCDYQLGSA
jgi:hypothetical protein